MKRMRTGLAAVAAALVMGGGLAGAARADTVDDALAAAGYKAVPCKTHDEAQESADHDLAQAALEKLTQGDVAGAEAMMPDLRAALKRAPDAPALPEHCGNSLNVYSDELSDLLAASLVLSKSPDLAGVSAVLKGASPYGYIAFVIGWVEYEQRDYAAALTDYAKGRLNEPDSVGLASEYASTLSALGRSQDALDATVGFLDAHPGLDKTDRALLLRRKGYALVDLGRWDEGEAAYKESLELEPGNDVAQSELDYIAQNRPKTGA